MGRSHALKTLLDKFDCFGWIPTIRGSLTLDFVNDSTECLGDVDCHTVVVDNQEGFNSEHYIAATSLANVNDKKYGKDYSRLFRYVFVGSIHNQKFADEFIKKYNLGGNEDVTELIKTIGVLTGRLLIIVKDQYDFFLHEAAIIRGIKDLSAARKEYQDKFSVDAAAMTQLEALRRDMTKEWKLISEEVDELASLDDHYIYSFDVLLTRDGLLLIKNTSSDKSNKTFFIKGTASDYTQNIAIHRVFKCALNFIKHLFHNHYHHNRSHDTYLPASNLHPYRESHDFLPIFKHQLNAFVSPIMRLKRSNFKRFNIDCNGIMLYAKSFVMTCAANNLIDKEEAERTIDYMQLQIDEVDYLTRHKKNQINSLMSQRNWILIIAGVMALTAGVIEIAGVGIKFPVTEDDHLKEKSEIVYLVVCGIILTFWVCYEIAHAQVQKYEFQRSHNKSLLNFLKVDSDLRNARLSLGYRAYLWCMDQYLKLGRRKYQYIRQIFNVIALIAVVVLILIILPL